MAGPSRRYLALQAGIDALFVAFIEIFSATAGRVVISLGSPSSAVEKERLQLKLSALL